jgi:hypothetical protein
MSDQVWIDAARGAAHQSAKCIKICGRRSLGDQVSIEKGVMSDLIISVIMDIILHFIFNRFQGVRIGFIARAARNFGILDAAKLVVLNPKSASSSSSAAGKRSSAASPDERLPLASAVRMLPNSPAPTVPAPRAMVLPRKERRLMDHFADLFIFSKLPSTGRLSLPLGPFAAR